MRHALPVKRILVIADDLTGAAEIGGIALSYGLSAVIQCRKCESVNADAIIVDTDTRHLDGAGAAAKIESILRSVDRSAFDLVYKKTDSMLRGPVAAEISAILSALKFERALLIPQNPSRKRVIEKGQYLIDGVPLHLSPVATDPQHSPKTSDVCELFDSEETNVRCVEPGEAATAKFTIGCATIQAEIQQWAAKRETQTLPAGGADFFTATLQSMGLSSIDPRPLEVSRDGAIFVFGSASQPSRDFVERLLSSGFSVCDVSSSAISEARRELLDQYEFAGRAFVAARAEVSPRNAGRIRETMAVLISTVVGDLESKTLFIEGGATASAILAGLGITDLEVVSALAPGVIALRAIGQAGPLFVLKPGTYPWPPGVLPEVTEGNKR
jgi:uncharacterized protein YgbK (DUF1537 family)